QPLLDQHRGFEPLVELEVVGIAGFVGAPPADPFVGGLLQHRGAGLPGDVDLLRRRLLRRRVGGAEKDQGQEDRAHRYSSRRKPAGRTERADQVVRVPTAMVRSMAPATTQKMRLGSAQKSISSTNSAKPQAPSSPSRAANTAAS